MRTREGALESARQLLGMWKALIEDCGTTATVQAGVAHRWADAAFAFYNTLSFGDPDVGREALERRIAHIANFMRSTDKAGYFWLFEELLLPEAQAALEGMVDRAGLIKAMALHGMAGDILPFPDPTHPALRFERATTPAHLDAYASLNARAYGLPEADAREVFTGSRLWPNDIHAYLGWEGDVPVCCAGVKPIDGCLFVVLVATDPACQRRGYGQAITRKALFEGYAATGLTRATLQATGAGRPVYERIGMQETCRISLYTLAPTERRL